MNENYTPAARIDGASISVPPFTPIAAKAPKPANLTASWTSAQWEEFNDRLDRLNADCDPKMNQNDHARVLIAACIGEGLNTVSQIITALVPLGFNNRHLASMLTKGKGGWLRRDADGVLSLAAD